MRVLLIYPWFPDTYWSFRHALSLQSKRSIIPPLGLITISAMLPASWEKRLVDLNVRSLADEDLDWADIVFASAMHIQKDSLAEVIQRCKAKGKRVVVGGPHVSLSPEEVPDADHIFIGEAEATLHLSLMNRVRDLPWQLSFSYGRALQQSALDAWKGKAANFAAGQQAFALRARLNGLARDGSYEAAMEQAAA